MAEQFQRVVAIVDKQDPPITGWGRQPEEVTARAGRVELYSVDLDALRGGLDFIAVATVYGDYVPVRRQRHP